MDCKTLVILDGNSLINRAFYALPPMINSKGLPTGALYGFTNMLLKILNDIKPDYVIAAFDRKAPTFRHLEYDEYKAGRKKMPEELYLQFKPLKDLLNAFNVGIYEIDTYEADDIIGTIAQKYESDSLRVIIYTGDKDALQLVSDYTTVMITKKGISETDIYDKLSLREKYGFEPNGIIELKGLMGDSSDNLPGVPGVGEKTALKLLNEYGSIDNIYENIENINTKKLKQNLVEYKDSAIMSKRLATIFRDVPIEINIEKAKTADYHAEEILKLMTEFEFKSLIDKIKILSNTEDEYKLGEVKMFDGNTITIDNIVKKGIFSFSFLFSNDEIKGIVIENHTLVPPELIINFKYIFENNDIKKITFDGKAAYLYLRSVGIELRNLVFDAVIAGYLLNPSESSYTAYDLLHRYNNINLSVSQTKDESKVIAELVDKLDSIRDKMYSKILEYGMHELFDNVEMPLIEVLASMEYEGFKVNRDTLNTIGFDLSEEIDRLTSQIYEDAGEEFNINSPKQLGVILFEKLELPIIKKTKTGYSTDAEVLEELSSKHQIVDNILHYRQLVKLKSTYIDGLIEASSKDGKIHSSFNQTITATGRISSTEPNMQNIPVKLEQGKRIRKAFVPEKDNFVILSADYSQIELRLLAHISQDENMIHAFNNNIDIHTKTASEVFKVKIDEVTSLHRSRAKAVNFGIVYGLSDYGLSRDIKISRKEAKSYIENYFETYIGVKHYLDKAIEIGREKGYVTTLMNRIRFIPEINSSNRNVKMFGERLAMNTPIQGTAADIIKIAMVNVYRRLKNENLKSKLILQVHDELVIEVYSPELDYVKSIVQEEMEGAMKLSVNLTVDINIGSDWYNAK